jgi:hypothetical protein
MTKLKVKPGMVVPIYNPNTQETDKDHEFEASLG